MKTPLKTSSRRKSAFSVSEIRNWTRLLDKWEKKLDKWNVQISRDLRKLGLIFAAMLLLSGCQAFPTLTHPRAAGDYSFWSEMPYYNPYSRPSFYPDGYYMDAPVSRNDFIIATEGGF